MTAQHTFGGGMTQEQVEKLAENITAFHHKIQVDALIDLANALRSQGKTEEGDLVRWAADYIKGSV